MHTPRHPVELRRRSAWIGSLTLVLATAGIGTTLVGTLPAAHAAEAPVATQSSAHAAALPADPALRAAMQLFQRAADGDAGAIEPAVEAWTQLSKAQPADPVRLAYLGSATSMQATTTWMPWRKIAHAENGLALLDKALSMLSTSSEAASAGPLPAALEVRFTAASTFLALPSMFNRQARGEKLLAEVVKHPSLGTAPLSFRGAVWLAAGRHAKQAGQTADARRWLQEVVAQGAPQAAAAQALLRELGA
jgi:hypothetical protein